MDVAGGALVARFVGGPNALQVKPVLLAGATHRPFITAIGPVVAPAGTVAVICASLWTVNTVFVPLNVTAVVPMKLFPLIVTGVPAMPLGGSKLLMDCGISTFRAEGSEGRPC